MNSLDDLFSEALTREELTTTQERRFEVGDIAVRGARRRRRVHATAQTLAVVAVVGLGAAFGSAIFAQGNVAPANPTPTPTQPTPNVTTEPDLDYASAIDGRFPQAPTMSADDWANVTLAWDAELVSFVGGGKDVVGSVVAVYLTPPGGSRMLAFATDSMDLGSPTLLGFDAKTRSVMLSDRPSSNAVRTLNLVTGVVGEAPLLLDEPISGYLPLGKISNGDSIFVVTTVDSKSEHTQNVFRSFDDTAVQVTDGPFALSTVWNDRFVVIQDGEFTFMDADGTSPPSIEGADGCHFETWSTDGTFVAICGATQTRTGTYVRVDPDTGMVTTLWEGAVLDSGTEGLPSFTADHAIDGVRSWRSELANSIPVAPPVLYSNGVQVVDLADGFGEAPAGYGIIFGIQNP